MRVLGLDGSGEYHFWGAREWRNLAALVALGQIMRVGVVGEGPVLDALATIGSAWKGAREASP